jgi:hypothetical protein
MITLVYQHSRGLEWVTFAHLPEDAIAQFKRSARQAGTPVIAVIRLK